ncbi:MAG: NADH-quinone oxidoreductase subunit J [Gemmatimonadota bacterium]|jgi:NADH-quinone oxidoreductase subunit J|nr:NADH-quinone oxidoreductase subunit J [Gemmatimonadota bacterium]MDP6802516.1 NADH-quinone oxidoreductase subunit J [Gemmatimonadota bacterium]MDP7031779.1 NADH-quinone oxidoreductase subunit J [Gemmatimonadota bacterium]
MSGEVLLFWGTAAWTILSAMTVAFARSLIYAALGLLGTLLGVAVLYGYLGSPFLAGAQVMLYVGGVLILMLFAIVLTRQLGGEEALDISPGQRLAGIFVAMAAFATIWVGIAGIRWSPGIPDLSGGPSPEDLGNAFMTDWLLPFEVASVLLLAALIGATVMVRRKRP